VFYFLEAAAQAGEALGLPPETARRLAVTTFSGASRLASESSNSLAALREQVTSKGGTTERALASMERDGVKAAIVRAIHAANERARELGDELARS
jgi:pyrroline-5-carboxylate reductase